MDATRPAILWDVDGTLVDSEPLHEAALIRALYNLVWNRQATSINISSAAMHWRCMAGAASISGLLSISMTGSISATKPTWPWSPV